MAMPVLAQPSTNDDCVGRLEGKGKNMLKNAFALVIIAALMAAVTASAVGAHPGKGKAYGLERQPICHKPAGGTSDGTTGGTTGEEETTIEETTGGTTGEEETTVGETGRTLYLPKPAIKAHLKHGDVLGACGSEATAPNTSSGDTMEPHSTKKNQQKHEERLSEHPRGKDKE